MDAEEKLEEIEHLNEAEDPVCKMADDLRITRFFKKIKKRQDLMALPFFMMFRKDYFLNSLLRDTPAKPATPSAKSMVTVGSGTGLTAMLSTSNANLELENLIESNIISEKFT